MKKKITEKIDLILMWYWKRKCKHKHKSLVYIHYQENYLELQCTDCGIYLDEDLK